jgi:hypothetical protein
VILFDDQSAPDREARQLAKQMRVSPFHSPEQPAPRARASRGK